VLAALLELVDKGLVLADPLGDDVQFVVLQTVRIYVARLRSGPHDAGSMVPGESTDDPLSLRERLARPGQPAA
jgi:hypothetical protein